MMADRLGERILVLGAGNFGTCLAQHLAEKGYRVTLWTRDEEQAHAINETRRNPLYLSSITLSSRITATHVIDAALMEQTSVVLQVIPTQGMREALTPLKKWWRSDLLLVCAAKGIELGTMELPGGIIAGVLGKEIADRSVFLSGPSFASEVAARQPTCVVAASRDAGRAQWAQELLHAPHFRVYTSDDPIGLEVAGALKNVVAIAAGATVGIGFQMNSRAALITRGLAEMTRVGVALGASPITFQGLGGVGDLFLTCTSEKSRNFTVGYRLGRGEALAEVLQSVGSVAEGVSTTEAAYKLAEKLQVDAPIIKEVWRCLYEQKPIAQAVMDLLTREAKAEFRGIKG
jgi:glycerol-3-phosphate dehydrogenase (NAD(P)+)